jgi:hypothetical protein
VVAQSWHARRHPRNSSAHEPTRSGGSATPAFAGHKGAYIVAAIYSPTGSLLSTAAKKVPLTSAFDASHWNGVEQLGPRDSQMLVELATGRHLENLRMAGGQTMHTAPHTVIVYAVLNSSP